jgi:hypothetical protein
VKPVHLVPWQIRFARPEVTGRLQVTAAVAAGLADAGGWQRADRAGVCPGPRAAGPRAYWPSYDNS